MTYTEAQRSRAWGVAKPVAIEQWTRSTSGELSDEARAHMLISVSRAVDAVLAELFPDEPPLTTGTGT